MIFKQHFISFNYIARRKSPSSSVATPLSIKLFEITQNAQKKDQLQYCSECRNTHKAKKELVLV